jgi:dTDP-4-dehydrorhamnose 3,5-epimerase
VAEVFYKVSALYDAAEERTITWNDPEIGVKWPIAEPLLSKRDHAGESFSAYRQRVSP